MTKLNQTIIKSQNLQQTQQWHRIKLSLQRLFNTYIYTFFAQGAEIQNYKKLEHKNYVHKAVTTKR